MKPHMCSFRDDWSSGFLMYACTVCGLRTNEAGVKMLGKKKPTKPRKINTAPKERDEQVALARWLDRAGLLWCHVPNGGFRSLVTARRLKQEGVKPGVPDVLIFSSPTDYRTEFYRSYPRRGVAIELKRTSGGRVSAEQKEWFRRLEEEGWLCKVCKGADEAIAWLEELGYKKEGT